MKNNHKLNLNPCPMCGAEAELFKVAEVRGKLSEYAVRCSACMYVSEPVIGLRKCVERHNGEGKP